MRNRAAYADPAARDTPGFVSSTSHPGQPSHEERDALAGAGLTGAAGYETEKRQNQHGVNEGYNEKNPPKDHHYGRDAAAVGAVGLKLMNYTSITSVGVLMSPDIVQQLGPQLILTEQRMYHLRFTLHFRPDLTDF